jgi:MoCo/4Fe-4S cofactor protein with predicted Tat translocation signal
MIEQRLATPLFYRSTEMPNVFHPAMNTVSRVSIFGAVFIVAGIVGLLWQFVRTPYVTKASMIREQPVPFSHQHHVSDAGIHCRYCHTSVEDSAFAGIPSTSICMNCHSFLFSDQEMLQPVRASLRSGKPLEWTRVHDVADFAYFDHSLHLKKGVGCVSCHGRVDQMPLMWREHSLLMEWCLQCHRDPTRHLRPREFVFRMESLEELATTREFQDYLTREFPELATQPVDLSALQSRLASTYHVRSEMNCSRCHW